MPTRLRRASTTPLLAIATVIALSAAACGAAAGNPTLQPVAQTAPPSPGTAASSSAEASLGTASQSSPGTTAQPPAPAPGASSGAGPAAPSANSAAEALAERPWATATLTDVTTGRTFTIAGLAGRTVFVEAMAIWCTNCRAQQSRFAEALARLDPAKVAYVVVTVDPAETAADLARYRADRGFSGTYAVAGRDVSAALESEFGPNVLNPPSVPLVVISPAGDVAFTTGGESVDDIVRAAGG